MMLSGKREPESLDVRGITTLYLLSSDRFAYEVCVSLTYYISRV